jgi:hypothetical protein
VFQSLQAPNLPLVRRRSEWSTPPRVAEAMPGIVHQPGYMYVYRLDQAFRQNLLSFPSLKLAGSIVLSRLGYQGPEGWRISGPTCPQQFGPCISQKHVQISCAKRQKSKLLTSLQYVESGYHFSTSYSNVAIYTECDKRSTPTSSKLLSTAKC